MYMNGLGVSGEYKDRHGLPRLRVGNVRRKTLETCRDEHTEAHTSQSTKKSVIVEELFLDLWVEWFLQYSCQFLLFARRLWLPECLEIELVTLFPCRSIGFSPMICIILSINANYRSTYPVSLNRSSIPSIANPFTTSQSDSKSSSRACC